MPMPSHPPANSSVLITTMRATDAAIRTPVTMNGAALGRDTRHSTDRVPKPKLRRLSFATGSTSRSA
jgi:hypothetical protein